MSFVIILTPSFSWKLKCYNYNIFVWDTTSFSPQYQYYGLYANAGTESAKGGQTQPQAYCQDLLLIPNIKKPEWFKKI